MNDNSSKKIIEIIPSDWKEDQILFKVYAINSCNFNCTYCYNEKPRTNQVLDLDKLASMLLKFKAVHKRPMNVILIGGETTLHPQLMSFCKLMFVNDIKTTVFTNFSADMSMYLSLLQMNSHIIVSWHRSLDTEQLVSKFKQINKDDYRNMTFRVMFEYENQQKSLDVFYRMRSEFPDFNNYETSVINDNDNYTHPQKYDDKLYDEFEKITESLHTTDIIVKYSDGSQDVVQDDFFFGHLDQKTDFRHWICAAGVDFVYIHVDGRVSVCPDYVDQPLMNINTSYQLILPDKKKMCNKKVCHCAFFIKKKDVFSGVNS